MAVGVFAFDARGRVLLVQRGRPPAQGLWSVPGGKVGWGETLADACRREVLEETGVEITVGPLVTWLERIDPTHHFVILDFIGAPTQAVAEPRPGDDAAQARWLTQDELQALPLTAGFLPVLAQARRLAGLP